MEASYLPMPVFMPPCDTSALPSSSLDSMGTCLRAGLVGLAGELVHLIVSPAAALSAVDAAEMDFSAFVVGADAGTGAHAGLHMISHTKGNLLCGSCRMHACR